jgi:hypothetical protein
MELLIGFLLLSFFLGYGFSDRIRQKKNIILAGASLFLCFVFFNYLNYW